MAARKRRSPRKPPKPPPARETRRVSPILVWSALGVVALVGLAAIALLAIYPTWRGPGAGREVELALMGDESTDALASRLESAGLVTDPRLFSLYLRFSSAGRPTKGTHLLTDDLTPREILARLARKGSAIKVKVTIPEGWTRFDIGKRMQSLHVCTQKALVEATIDHALLDEMHVDGDSAEGFLFPATYELAADSDPADVVRRMKAEFDKRYVALDQKHPSGILDLSSSLGWSMREIVNLASIVEKEAAVDEERPIIAGVFLNRLRDPNFKKHILQSDPTAGYGCMVLRDKLASCAGYAGRITHDINADPDNPYSTYTHEKLPPGPICNPGVKSLEAVMSPAATRYLYFVARGEGRHTFSETFENHAAAVKDSGPRR
jgi:UPF0755 protein